MMSEPDGEKTVVVSDLSHTYQSDGSATDALKDVSFTAKTGEFLSIVGPSGCGKSSLLMMVAGLLAPTSGEIGACGRPIRKPDPRRLGVIFQDASLFPWLSARGNVEFPLSLRGISKAERKERADNCLELVGLKEFAESYPRELSGGMRQRVAIARGLVSDPPILLMDEPFAALDEQTRMFMGDELLRIWEETGKTIIFVTHGLSEAVYLSDRVVVLSGRPGRILDEIDVNLGRPRNLDMMASPAFGEIRGRIWQQIRWTE